MRDVLAILAAVGALSLGACAGASSAAPPSSGASASGPSGAPAETAAGASDAPASPELSAGIKAFDAGNYPDARKAFEAATKKNPNDYEAFHNLGLACEKLGDKPAAEAAYKAALALKPDLDGAAVSLSSIYLDTGRVDDALAVGRAALSKHPASAPLHENVGIALASRNDQDTAMHELEEAVKLQPSDPMFQFALAHWLNVWHVRGAAPHLDAARDLVKDDYAMIASIGHEYRMAGEFDACVKTFEKAIALKDGGEVRTGRALCRLGLKDEKGALDDLQAAVAKEPTYPTAHYYFGTRLAVAKRFKEAAAEYAKYLELAPTGSLAKPATERLKAAQDAAKTAGGGQKKK